MHHKLGGDYLWQSFPRLQESCAQMNETLPENRLRTFVCCRKSAQCIGEGDAQSHRRCHCHRNPKQGKWIILSLNNGEHILISLGMGADILYFENESEDRRNIRYLFPFRMAVVLPSDSGGSESFSIVHEKELASEPYTKDIAITPFHEAFTYDYFSNLLAGKKGQIKPLLLIRKTSAASAICICMIFYSRPESTLRRKFPICRKMRSEDFTIVSLTPCSFMKTTGPFPMKRISLANEESLQAMIFW